MVKKMELISIVVPVYNVQEFLSKCLDSILIQTYRNIEIIVVDDGSKDDSGKICDQYGDKYTNIKVLHKSNGGLSDARNKGIENSSGEYVVFVDSDDVIAPNLVEYLYSLIKNKNADIGICDPMHCYPKQEICFENSSHEYVFDSEKAIIEMLYQRSFLVAAWGKIYPISFFDDIKFPVGMLFEDSAVMYKLFDKASRVAYGNAKLYGYMHRENSITTKQFSIQDCDILIICNQIDSYLASRSDELIKAAQSYHIAAAFRVYMNAPRTGEFDKQILISKNFLDKNSKKVLFDKGIRTKIKIALILYKFARPIMWVVYRRVNRWK